MVPINSWGRLSRDEHEVVELTHRDQIQASLKNASSLGLAHGMGRSYGDVCLNPGGTLWCTTALNRFIAFDEGTGRLVCEAGVLLRDIQNLFVPRGWALPVTPGTQLITVGGAVANDVHGKNHHVHGSFGDHLRRLTLIRTDGEIINCGPNVASNWFHATVGGMGLTGVIVQAEIQLRRVKGPWLNSETIPYANLNEFFELADSSESDWEHTVSWIDCIASAGRGQFMRANAADIGEHPAPLKRKLKMPFVPPISLVNRLTLRPFNTAYFHLKNFRAGNSIVHYEKFFYPLDNLNDWNRMYGPKGFYQYQCLIPREFGRDAVKSMLKEISQSGEGSFLAVLKTFGDRQPVGMMSFPQPGVTLALDFPNHGDRIHKLFSRLDTIVKEANGRIYPAKDARMSKKMFEAGYPRLIEFLKYRDSGISSALAQRLMGI